MKVLISQSNYIPWRGFIDLISHADVYVVYDTMQFTKNDWRNRNLVRNKQQVQWLSIPCGKSISRKIDEVYPVGNDWIRKHSATLKHCYSRALYWSKYGPELLQFYQTLSGLSLSQINVALLKYCLKLTNIDVEILLDTSLLSRESLLSLERNKRLLMICQELNADIYLSAPAAKSYLDVNLFVNNSIKPEFYKYPSYPNYTVVSQELSWIDCIMHTDSLSL